jgi:hypothetical protein
MVPLGRIISCNETSLKPRCTTLSFTHLHDKSDWLPNKTECLQSSQCLFCHFSSLDLYVRENLYVGLHERTLPAQSSSKSGRLAPRFSAAVSTSCLVTLVIRVRVVLHGRCTLRLYLRAIIMS